MRFGWFEESYGPKKLTVQTQDLGRKLEKLKLLGLQSKHYISRSKSHRYASLFGHHIGWNRVME